MRNNDRPTVSKTRARAPTATVSRGLFSVVIWAMNYTSSAGELYMAKDVSAEVDFGRLTDGADEAKKIKDPRYAAPL